MSDAIRSPRLPLGVIRSPNPRVTLHFCDARAEIWHGLINDPEAGAAALLSMTTISRRRRSRGMSLRRA